MKLASYRFMDGQGLAAIVADAVVDLRPVAGDGMRAFLARGPTALTVAAAFAEHAPRAPLDEIRLLPPVADPAAFIGVGLNYRDHARQIGRALPERPAVFAKLAAAIAPPFGAIPRDPAAPTLDYEGELGLVIGQECRRVTAEQARDFIAGYVVVNDVTVRARVTPDTVMWAKGGVGHAPFGPWIATADEVGDPHRLTIRTWVNGELRQDGTTADLHFDCFALVAWLSESVTLAPGDIVTTGSPGGSGASFDPPRYLAPGDRVRIEIERIGAIEQTVVDEP